MGYLGLLNLRRVDRKKAAVEIGLPGVTFVASEEEPGEKVRRMKAGCTEMTTALASTVRLNLDIARYSTHSDVAPGTAAILL